MPARWPFGLATAGLVAFGAPARAHHPVSDYGISGARPRSTVELDVQAAAYDFEGRRGEWQLIAPTVEYAPLDRLSLLVRAPFARVAPDDGDVVVGISDVEVALKLLLWELADGRLTLSAGSGVELPTGNEDVGLGNGHFEVTPFVAASAALPTPPAHPVFVYGVVSDRASLGGGGANNHEHDGGAGHDHDTPHGSVISPHADNEISTRLRVAYAPQPWYFAAGVEAVHILVGEGRGPWVGTGEVGWMFTERWRLAGGFDLPFAGDRRFDWRARLALAASF